MEEDAFGSLPAQSEPVKKKATLKKDTTKKTAKKKIDLGKDFGETPAVTENTDNSSPLHKVWTDEEMDKSLKEHLAKEAALQAALKSSVKKEEGKESTVEVSHSEIIKLKPSKGKTKNVFKTKSLELLKEDSYSETIKYTASNLFSTTGDAEYNSRLNVELVEHKGHLVDLGYFNKKSISGILDYTKLAETPDEELGFDKLEKKYNIKDKRGYAFDKHMKELSSYEVKDMTEDDKNALNYFTSNNYSWVNNALFKKEVNAGYEGKDVSKDSLSSVIDSYEHDKESLKKITKHLDEALSKGVKQQRILYRGIKSHAEFLKDKNGTRIEAAEWVDQNLKVGSEIKFDGYQSSTPSAAGVGGYASENGIIYEIITPEGVNVESITQFSGEYEVTLPRNARYTVASITKGVDVQVTDYSTKRNNTVVRLIAINSKGEVLDGTNSDPVEPITDEYFNHIEPN